MKSLADLQAIRESMKDKVALREGINDIRVVVSMGTCGIEAGARTVLNAFVEEVANQGVWEQATVTQSGCIGICQYEPAAEVFGPGKEKITYVKLDAEKVKRIVEEHIKGGNPVHEYTIGAEQK